MPGTAFILVAICFCLCGSVVAQSFDRLTPFDSSDKFMAALREFRPQKQSNIYSRAFAIEDFGESGSDALIVPEKIESVDEVWHSDDYALVFATARPKTEASASEVAVLMVLWHVNDAWRFRSLRRYEAIGKDARITCELTSASHKPYVPGQGSSPAVVTFKRHSGGRGHSESTSWSLLFTDGRLYEHR